MACECRREIDGSETTCGQCDRASDPPTYTYDDIVSLIAERDRLMEAIAPFALTGGDRVNRDVPDDGYAIYGEEKMGDYRRAYTVHADISISQSMRLQNDKG